MEASATPDSPAPLSASHSARSQAPLPRTVDVAIVGAGFGGLGTAIRLKQEGNDDFVVLERASDVGGTWFANTYPGCQCDIPSNLYSFSFAPKSDWTRSYPQQPQILDYLRDCASRFKILPHIRFNCEMQDAAWLPDEQRWRVETPEGTVTARILVAAPGLLSEPSVPRLPGLERFTGTVFHSAAWNHEHDLGGEDVAVIGTGATAIQIVPRIQPLVRRLHVFQRTPPWVLPHPDREIGPRTHSLYRTRPSLQRLVRRLIYSLHEGWVLGLAYDPRLLKLAEAVARIQMRVQVRDRALRRRLTPDYTIGCKRIVLSSDWYPTLTAPGSELVTDAIDEVREHGIVTADGRERRLDTIILATGFSPSDPPIARRLRGADGRTLSEVWQGSPQAYLGTTVAGFPNLFLLYGPNLNLGHSSIVYMLEAQIGYLTDALAAMRRAGARTLEVRAEVQRQWNATLQRRLAGSVWDTGGCSSWYLDRNGRNSVMWPDFTFRFNRRMHSFDPNDYRLSADAPAPQLVA